MNETLVILPHMGLGDHIICAAIVRERAGRYARVLLPVKVRNLPTVSLLHADTPNVHFLLIQGEDDGAHMTVNAVRQALLIEHADLLAVGALHLGTPHTFDCSKFDREFYRRADLPFERRWTGWVEPDTPQLPPPLRDYIFIHEDRDRGYGIDRQHLPDLYGYFVSQADGHPLFAYGDILRDAKEIHCINSSVALWVDSQPDLAGHRKVLHTHARPGAIMPILRNNWTFL